MIIFILFRLRFVVVFGYKNIVICSYEDCVVVKRGIVSCVNIGMYIVEGAFWAIYWSLFEELFELKGFLSNCCVIVNGFE